MNDIRGSGETQPYYQDGDWLVGRCTWCCGTRLPSPRVRIVDTRRRRNRQASLCHANRRSEVSLTHGFLRHGEVARMLDPRACPPVGLPEPQAVVAVGKFVEAIEILLRFDVGPYFRAHNPEPFAELAPRRLDQQHVSSVRPHVHLVPMVTGKPRKLTLGRGNHLSFLVGPPEVNGYRAPEHEERFVLKLVNVGKRAVVWRPGDLGD